MRVDQLQPGDRVMLHVKGDEGKYRPAVFVDVASAIAVFVLDVDDKAEELHAAFAVERDGSLRDDEDRTITVERLGRVAYG